MRTSPPLFLSLGLLAALGLLLPFSSQAAPPLPKKEYKRLCRQAQKAAKG